MKTEVAFDWPRNAQVRLSQAVSSGHAEVLQSLAARSQLVWGEHCSECAYPVCYTSCALYTPRRDGHCRRFEAGFEALADAPNFKRVVFRQWGKVEAKGPARPLEPEHREQSLVDRAFTMVSRTPLMIPAVGRKFAYLLQTASVAERSGGGSQVFDAFVLEAMSGDDRRHDLTLTIYNVDSPDARLFQAHVKVGPDYGRTVIDAAAIAAHVDLEAPYLAQIEPLNEAAGRVVVFGFCDFVRWRGSPLASTPTDRDVQEPSAAPAKVLVWDLDDTLWRGTLSEDGLEGLRIRPEAVAAIMALDERGVLQSVASKNHHDEAMRALEHFGLAEYFLFPQIGWEPKSAALGRLAELLNLGLDSFVLIDDQPFERAEVMNAFPKVRVVDHEQAAALAGMDCFQAPVTAESRRRRSLYRTDQKRQAAFVASGEDYRAFLSASGMTLTLEALSNDNQTRVYELSQRTNQLNFNGRKYSEAELRALVDDPGGLAIAMHCEDRYGGYGLIGFAQVELETGRVRQLFMSCRVQKKRVEDAFLDWLRLRLKSHGATLMSVDYTPTERNSAAKAMLERLGFRSEGDGSWSRNLLDPFEGAEVVLIEDRLGAQDGTRLGFADRWAKRAASASHDLSGLALCLGGATLGCC